MVYYVKQRILFYRRLGKSYIQISRCLSEEGYAATKVLQIHLLRVRMGAVQMRAYEFKLQAYIPAATDIPITIHVCTYGRSTLTFFCHVP